VAGDGFYTSRDGRGDDSAATLVDAVRSISDGHVVLSRSMAACGVVSAPVDVLDSAEPLMPAVTTPEPRERGGCRGRLLGGCHARRGSGAHRRRTAGNRES